MTHFCELFTSQTVRTLRGTNFEQEVVNNEHLSPEVYFSWDDEKGAVAIKAVSQPSVLLDMAIGIETAPRWFSLNIGVGRGHFMVGDCLGLIIEAETEIPFDVSPFIRTAVEDGYGDTGLASLALKPTGRQVLSSLHIVQDGDALTNDGFQTLVLPLLKENSNWSLYDMRFFVIPAAQFHGMLRD